MADLITQTRAYWRNNNMIFRDDQHSGTRGVSLWETAPVLAAMCDPNVGCLFYDDMHHYDATATVGNWVTVTDAGSAIIQSDDANGVLNIGTDGDDEDETVVAGVAQNWLFDADRPLWFEARVSCAEAGTDAANLIVGLSDTVALGAMLDAGAGPMASYDGAVFFKVDGGAVWQFETSNAGTQVTNTSVGTYAASTFYRVGFTYNPSGGTTGVITPYLDGAAGTAQNITLSGLQEMQVILGIQTGSINEEILKVDYVKVLQRVGFSFISTGSYSNIVTTNNKFVHECLYIFTLKCFIEIY